MSPRTYSNQAGLLVFNGTPEYHFSYPQKGYGCLSHFQSICMSKAIADAESKSLDKKHSENCKAFSINKFGTVSDWLTATLDTEWLQTFLTMTIKHQPTDQRPTTSNQRPKTIDQQPTPNDHDHDHWPWPWPWPWPENNSRHFLTLLDHDHD